MKTHEQYCEELKKINQNLIPIEQYKGAHFEILHLCTIHNETKLIKPTNALNGCGCTKCRYEKVSKSITLSHDEYCDRLKKQNPTVIPLEEYKGNKIQIKHKCIIHNIVWETSPGSVLGGGGCKLCSSERLSKSLRKTQDEYEKQLFLTNPNIICIDIYNTLHTPIKHKCLKCNYEWMGEPGNIIYGGTGCPNCNISRGENIIKTYLDNNNISYISQYRFDDCRDKYTLPFDFFLNIQNKCIEFDGKQHFNPDSFFGGEEGLKYIQLHDNIKNEYCEKNNIPLLRIPYYTENIETVLENVIFN